MQINDLHCPVCFYTTLSYRFIVPCMELHIIHKHIHQNVIIRLHDMIYCLANTLIIIFCGFIVGTNIVSGHSISVSHYICPAT